MPVTQLKRDPFSRRALMRDSHSNDGSESCSWCGIVKRTRYRYWWEDDSGNQSQLQYGNTFCSVGCYRSYSEDE